MIAFKHVPAEFAEGFRTGQSIQVGSLAHYRAAEGERGDRLEGVAEYQFGRPQPYDEFNPDLAHVRKFFDEKLGIPITGSFSRNILVTDNVIRYVQPTIYIFCMSSQPDFTRLDKGDLIFKVTDVELFAHRLAMRSNGVLGGAVVGSVRYGIRSIDPLRSGSLLEEGPFFKSADLNWENEIRVAWDARRDVGPTMILNAPRVARLIEVVEG